MYGAIFGMKKATWLADGSVLPKLAHKFTPPSFCFTP
ncbi:hypothetical protein A2U01_0080186, partial [Trifolium medium]|nr:hypothetical protein [Trifolium medium]